MYENCDIFSIHEEEHTVCPRGSDPINILTYYIKWVTTSWTYTSNNVT